MQVFGQTPLYLSGVGRWYLWPELPSHLVRTCPLLEGRKREEGHRAGEGRSWFLTAKAPLWLSCSCSWAIISNPGVTSLLCPGRSTSHLKFCLQFMGSIYKHGELERRAACVVAEKDTALSPLSRIPPESRRNSLLLTRLSSPCPQPPAPLAALGSQSKKDPAPLEAVGKLPCLGSAGEAGKEALQQPCSAGAPRFAGRAFGDCDLRIPLVPQHLPSP